MASTLTFAVNDDLKKIVAHTRKHGKCRVPYHDPPMFEAMPTLCLAKDDGVYLMSGSDKRLRAKDGGNLVVYANKLDPRKGDVWERASDLCGGDDFVEPLPLEIFEEAIAVKAKALKVRFTKTRVVVTVKQ